MPFWFPQCTLGMMTTILMDVDLAPTVGVQGHRLRETAEPQFPYLVKKKGNS